MKPAELPGILGNMGASGTTETSNYLMQEEVKKNQGQNNERKK